MYLKGKIRMQLPGCVEDSLFGHPAGHPAYAPRLQGLRVSDPRCSSEGGAQQHLHHCWEDSLPEWEREHHH
eukprot:5942609-Amphidinium_carterae.2